MLVLGRSCFVVQQLHLEHELWVLEHGGQVDVCHPSRMLVLQAQRNLNISTRHIQLRR